MNKDFLVVRVSALGTQLECEFGRCLGFPTKALKQAVKRNFDRFPSDFMFELSQTEKEEVVANCDHLAKLKFSPVLPYAFMGQTALTCLGPRSNRGISACEKEVAVCGKKQHIAGIAEIIYYTKSLHHECVTGQRRITEADLKRVILHN